MWLDRGRAKKLVVAFHFQFSNQAGWNCDACRKAGLEMKRRCGWLTAALTTPARPIWTRKRISTDRCPKSVVSAQSLTWLEEFFVWRKLRGEFDIDAEARKVEAFLILEAELEAEQHDGQQQTRSDRV
jgi:hypothetical protein